METSVAVIKIIALAMASGFSNAGQKTKIKGQQWSLAMFIPGSDRQCSCKVKGWQCSCGNVPVAMFLSGRGNVPAVRRF